jgi:ubiquinone/menaquinone biosynthesis C-methylase UbiE
MINPTEHAEPLNQPEKSYLFLPSRLLPGVLMGVHAAVSSATSTGLFRVLHIGPHTAAECAAKLNLNRRATEHVLEVLAEIGMVCRQKERYQMDAGLLELDWPSMETFLQSLQRHYAHTLHFLKTGEPLAFMDDSAEQREESYSAIVDSLWSGFRMAALTLAKKLPFKPTRILDVGCGSGVWSLTLALHHPGTHVIGIDFHKVLDVFEGRAQANRLGNQITRLPGDMYTVELPQEPVDLVLIANVLRLEAAKDAQALIVRFASALRPGGRLLILDAFASGTPEKNLMRAVYAFNLALRTNVGRVYAPAEVKAWMLAAKLGEPIEIDLGLNQGAIGAILAERLP